MTLIKHLHASRLLEFLLGFFLIPTTVSLPSHLLPSYTRLSFLVWIHVIQFLRRATDLRASGLRFIERFEMEVIELHPNLLTAD